MFYLEFEISMKRIYFDIKFNSIHFYLEFKYKFYDNSLSNSQKSILFVIMSVLSNNGSQVEFTFPHKNDFKNKNITYSPNSNE